MTTKNHVTTKPEYLRLLVAACGGKKFVDVVTEGAK